MVQLVRMPQHDVPADRRSRWAVHHLAYAMLCNIESDSTRS
jgi:hypothetical protein